MKQKIKIPISILGAGSVIYIDYPYEDKNEQKGDRRLSCHMRMERQRLYC